MGSRDRDRLIAVLLPGSAQVTNTQVQGWGQHGPHPVATDAGHAQGVSSSTVINPLCIAPVSGLPTCAAR